MAINFLAVRALGAAFVTVALAGPAAADNSSGLGYKLTMPVVESCHKAMVAVMKRAGSDAKLKAEIQDEDGMDMGNADSPEAFAADFERKSPVMAGTMKQNGCAGADFYKYMTAVMEAAFTQMAGQTAVQHGGKAETPTGIVAENIAFMEKNKARMNAMRAELEALKKATLGDD